MRSREGEAAFEGVRSFDFCDSHRFDQHGGGSTNAVGVIVRPRGR
jgi:hypothetical protein